MGSGSLLGLHHFWNPGFRVIVRVHRPENWSLLTCIPLVTCSSLFRVNTWKSVHVGPGQRRASEQVDFSWEQTELLTTGRVPPGSVLGADPDACSRRGLDISIEEAGGGAPGVDMHPGQVLTIPERLLVLPLVWKGWSHARPCTAQPWSSLRGSRGVMPAT